MFNICLINGYHIGWFYGLLSAKAGGMEAELSSKDATECFQVRGCPSMLGWSIVSHDLAQLMLNHDQPWSTNLKQFANHHFDHHGEAALLHIALIKRNMVKRPKGWHRQHPFRPWATTKQRVDCIPIVLTFIFRKLSSYCSYFLLTNPYPIHQPLASQSNPYWRQCFINITSPSVASSPQESAHAWILPRDPLQHHRWNHK